MTKDFQISSNVTLFYKMFLPTVWISFFGVFTLLLFIFPMDDSYLFSNKFRLGFLIGFIIFFLLLYFTVFKLKRVEFYPENWTATNYLKTFQYKYDDIEKMKTINIGLMRITSIRLKTKGSFGKKITLILNKVVFDQFLEQHPDLISAPIN